MVIITNMATDDTLVSTGVAVLIQIIYPIQSNLLEASSSLNLVNISALHKLLALNVRINLASINLLFLF